MSSIQQVSASCGLVDSLLWGVHVQHSADPRERIFLTKWVGAVEFLRSPTAAAQNARTLTASWEDEQAGARSSGVIDRVVQFRTSLPGDAFDRLESFRNGGRLFARLIGRFQVLFLGPYGAPLEAEVESLLRAYTEATRVLWLDVTTEPFEIPRDTWVEEILGQLRPPGRVVLECALPGTGAGEESAARRALDHLRRAQSEFDHGRYDYSADAVFKAIEALQSIAGAVETSYGEFVKKRITTEAGALSALANEVRHDEARMNRATTTIDRTLAQHLLAATKSLAAVVLQSPRTS